MNEHHRVPDPPSPIEAVEVRAAPAPVRKARRRNYWATIDPDEIVQYPVFQPLRYTEEVRLIQKARVGDLAARNELWLRNARLALTVANQFHIHPSQLADAIQAGTIGLIRAIEKYDIERYNAFSTYAWYWIYSKMQRELERIRHSIRVPVHLQKPVYELLRQDDVDRSLPADQPLLKLARLIRCQPLHEIHESEHPLMPEPVIPKDFSGFVAHVRKVLRAREFEIISCRFGLDDKMPQTLEEIATRLGVTRERIRQLESRSLRRLQRFAIREHGDLLYDTPPDREQPFQYTPPDSDPLTTSSTVPLSPLPPAEVVPEVLECPDEMQRIIFGIFKRHAFTFLQANSLIYHYGLMNTPQLPIPQIAELLETTARKVWLSIQKARKKFLRIIHGRSTPGFAELCEQIQRDPLANESEPPPDCRP